MLAVSIIPLPGWVLVGAGYAGYCYRGYAARFYETSGCAALQYGNTPRVCVYVRARAYTRAVRPSTPVAAAAAAAVVAVVAAATVNRPSLVGGGNEVDLCAWAVGECCR